MQGLSFKKLTSMAYLQKYYFRKKTNNVLYSTEKKNQLNFEKKVLYESCYSQDAFAPLN